MKVKRVFSLGGFSGVYDLNAKFFMKSIMISCFEILASVTAKGD